MIDVGRDFERMRDYVVGRLADDERRTFEDRLVRDPELVREFERSLRLREGLEHLRAQGYFEKSVQRARGFRIWPAALAAATIAGVALFLWLQPHAGPSPRSEEHTSELQSRRDLVCRLLLEKKKKNNPNALKTSTKKTTRQHH